MSRTCVRRRIFIESQLLDAATRLLSRAHWRRLRTLSPAQPDSPVERESLRWWQEVSDHSFRSDPTVAALPRSRAEAPVMKEPGLRAGVSLHDRPRGIDENVAHHGQNCLVAMRRTADQHCQRTITEPGWEQRVSLVERDGLTDTGSPIPERAPRWRPRSAVLVQYGGRLADLAEPGKRLGVVLQNIALHKGEQRNYKRSVVWRDDAGYELTV